MAKRRFDGSWLAIGSMLVSGGIGAGMLASSLTSSAIDWRPPARFHAVEPASPSDDVDQVASGQAWARSAFYGGLRRCPAMNPQFLSACEAEMKALEEQPEFAAGGYGGPLQVTNVEPLPDTFEAYPEPEPLEAEWRDAELDPLRHDEVEPRLQRVGEPAAQTAPAIELPPPLFVPA